MNIPTAEEFFSDKPTGPSDIEFWAKEFTKLHVAAAIKTASEACRLSKNGSDVPYGEHSSEKCGTWTVNKNTILECYPLENIK